ncbi:MAG: shikimate kinase / 3-dehydroquinate synthase, partial [Solirubrobacteraceae bacterium]|nr:shikimate kinase / 3-dehydroquinate synthase [Solirubrobacteraceae bacterium]
MVASLKPALVFIGFMGAGKSTAAREAAAALGVEAADVDALLEARLGEPIEAFFDRAGEAAFREAEQVVASELLDRADGGVIALGGGALQSERVRAALGRHTAILLDVELETAWARASGQGRPLARDRAAFAALYDRRADAYGAAADAVLPATGNGVVRRALDALQSRPEGLALLWATSTSGDYPVWVGRDAVRRAPWPLGGRRFAVTDETVAQVHGELLEGAASV